MTKQIYALIDANGTITNTIVCDGPPETVLGPEFRGYKQIDKLPVVPGIGWTLIDGVFTPPESPEVQHDDQGPAPDRDLQRAEDKAKNLMVDKSPSDLTTIEKKILIGVALTEDEKAELIAEHSFR